MRRINRRTVRSGVLVGLLLAMPFTLAPTPANLFVQEYPGSSEKEGREDSNDIFAIEHKLSVPIDPSSGLPLGPYMHTPLTVVKQIDKSTPGYHIALCNGETLAEVILRWYRIDPLSTQELEYYTITLTNARVVSIEPFMPMSFLPENEAYRHMEKVSFVYEEIEWHWIPDSIVESNKWVASRP